MEIEIGENLMKAIMAISGAGAVGVLGWCFFKSLSEPVCIQTGNDEDDTAKRDDGRD